MTARPDRPGPRSRSFEAMDILRRYVAEGPHLTYDELWAMVQLELDMDAPEAKLIRKEVESMLDIGVYFQEP